MQSKVARYILGIPRREWSKTAGYRELGWLTMPQTAVEFSLRMLFNVLWKKKPLKLLNAVMNEDGSIKSFSERELNSMTKLCRKSWRIRVTRYAKLVDPEFFHFDPTSLLFRRELKLWVKENIDPNGDYILKGKVTPPQTDWLMNECEAWKKRTFHDIWTQWEVENLDYSF